MAYPYRFKPGVSSGNGTGAKRFALLPPSTTQHNDGFQRPRYQVRGTLRAQHPAHMKTEQGLVAVGLRGNGQALQGQLALQALSQLTDGSKK